MINEIKEYVNNAVATKANTNHIHGISNVTNLQTTLDGKANSSHNHSASDINSGTLSSNRLPTVPVSKGGTGATTAAGALTNLGLTATSAELNYMDGVTSNVQTQLNAKANSNHTHSYLPLSGGTLSSSSAQIQRVGTSTSWVTGRSSALLKTNSYGGSNGSSAYSPILSVKSINGSWDLGTYTNDILHFSYITDTDFNNSNNVQTANIQFKKDGSITANTFNGSLSGNATTATTATKLGTNAGSATQPVYFSGGKPVATTYTLGKSVPSDAKFTDTNTWRGIQNNLTSSSTTDSLSANQGKELKTLIDGKAASSHNHSTSNITSGILSSDRLPTVPISKGGTGATTAANALVNLGITATSAELNKLDGVTATAAELNYIDGVTSNIQTQLNNKAASSHTHTDIKEAYLTWGGKNFAGSFGCVDAAMVPSLGANRLEFAKSDGITIEYSRDGGSTWTDYGSSTYNKTALFSSVGAAHLIGKADSTNKATSAYQLRITLDTGKAQVYTALNKFCIYLSTNGSTGCTVTIQRALESSPNTYNTIADAVPVSGWSGYNIINVSNTVTYGNTSSSQYGRIRFIFKCTGGSTTYNGLQVMQIHGYGGVGWTTPSNMAKNGHLYSYDANQNAIFPASITGAGAFSMNRKAGTTIGSNSVAVGYNNEASNQYSYAEGVDTKATDYASHAEGDRTTSSSTGSHAEGQSTTASGLQAHAEGRGSVASGSTSHAEGMGTTASATGAHSEGSSTKAEGMNCHAEGAATVAKGFQTHAEGNGTTSSGSSSHAEGDKTTASGFGSHAEGVSANKAESITTSINNPDIITAWGTSKFSLAKGEGSHVEGKNCIALESYSHAEGHGTTASGIYGSHAEGDETVASGQSSHAEGSDTVASGLEAHAEGNGCVASGSYSHAEGKSTTASGIYSHAQNLGTEASAFYSTAMGEYTKASSLAQTVMGKYNIEDTSDDFALIIGNGESDTERSDALKVAWDGSVYAGAYGGAYVKLDNYFNMYHQRTNTGDTWNIKNSSGSSKFSIGFENGNTSVAGTLKVTGATTAHSNITSTNSSASATDTRFIRVTNANNTVDIRTSTNAGLYHDASYGYGTAGWLMCINRTGTITTNTTSDARLKDKICDLSEAEACALLNNVNPIIYSYKADIEQNEKNVGFYAQDVRDVLIDNDIGYRSFLRIHDNEQEGEDIYDLEINEDDVTYGLDYSKFVPVLWKGWQVQQKQIRELEARIAELEKESC